MVKKILGYTLITIFYFACTVGIPLAASGWGLVLVAQGIIFVFVVFVCALVWCFA